MSRLTRRRALQLTGAAAAFASLPHFATAAEARRHGLAVIGDLKYAADFKRFDYVNPNAPKGGRLAIQSPTRGYNQNFNTFNTLNNYVLRGDGAMGMGYSFASLMESSSDEPGSVYAYAASEVEVLDGGKTLRFFLRPEARFHDGKPITAEDVAFSLTVLRDKGHPNLASQLKGVESVTAEDARTLLVKLGKDSARSLPTLVAGQPIFSKAFWQGRDFEASLSDIPMGSGPYRVKSYEFGRYIEFERVPNFWGAALPVMVGRFNVNELRYDYYRDRTITFEAFKKGDILIHEEFTSRNWATGYDFPAINDGRVVKAELPDGSPSGAQGWFINVRRAKFQDKRVRQALALAFDFEWTNRNIMFGSYARTASYFENSPLKAEGKPSATEIALLESFRAKLDPAVFGEVFVPPVSDGSGRDRNLLRQASDLLAAAGCKIVGSTLMTPDGAPFTVEFLMDNGSASTFEPHHNAYIVGLKLLGIEGTYRVVDASQATAREKSFDYDMVVSRFSMPLYPDEGILQYFSSKSAAQEGSENMSGIADSTIDAVLDKVVRANDWDEFVIASRALDRVLRAGHYWVPQWYKASHWLAYWDMFERPAIKPAYDRAIIDTWWVNAQKAARLGK